MSLPSQARPDFLQPRVPVLNRSPTIAVACGVCFGILACLFEGLSLLRIPVLDLVRLRFFIVLVLSFLSGIAAVVWAHKTSPSLAMPPSKWGRLGMTAGVFCSLIGGGSLTFFAVLKAVEAKTAFLDRALRAEAWLVLAVCMAALLPSVLCGFVGGLAGFRFSGAKQSQRSPALPPQASTALKSIRLTILIIASIGLVSPFGLLSKAPVVDPVPPVPVPPKPPVFLYESPEGIASAKVGEIQPDIIKTISGVQASSPVAMSPDSRLIAFERAENAGCVVAIYDLHRFVQISSIKLPYSPNGALAWSPDRKSIACTTGEGNLRRIWILSVADQTAIELPRPPARDVPNGNVRWWQKDELAFFPDDESSLAFDLDTLSFTPFVESPHFKRLDSARQQQWKDGPPPANWPQQTGWKLGLRTSITSAVPPPRRNPESPWELMGHTICAFEHPQLPLAFGIENLILEQGDRVFCAPDGSIITRLRDGEIQVVYMKMAVRPDMMLEVEMPRPIEQLGIDWKAQVDSKELCILLCAPMTNPLNREVVGADYRHVRAFARLHEWHGRKATFIVPTGGGKISPDDVAVTLHSWNGGKMSEWKAPGTQNWWSQIRLLSATPPESMTELEAPQLLDFEQEADSLLVTKYVSKPREKPSLTLSETLLARPSLSFPDLSLPSLPLPAPRPEPLAVKVSDSDVKTFLSEHHAKASRGDVSGMMADYDATVDFLNKGRIASAAIEAEEKAQRQKWPKGQEQVVDTIHVSEYDGVWSAAYTISFFNENAAGEWHKGRAEMMLNLRAEGKKLYITSQKARVYDVTDSRASTPKASAPPTQGQASRGGPITVPRPCFVMVTRPRDLPQIEFTDQISFANGVVWHRTYRELSADGKVLRTCRAIYEATNGGRVDRNTATFRIGIQGWDQNLGGGTFTGVCSKSARSLVGRTFEFQFVPGGMVENLTGMVFQRVE